MAPIKSWDFAKPLINVAYSTVFLCSPWCFISWKMALALSKCPHFTHASSTQPQVTGFTPKQRARISLHTFITESMSRARPYALTTVPYVTADGGTLYSCMRCNVCSNLTMSPIWPNTLSNELKTISSTSPCCCSMNLSTNAMPRRTALRSVAVSRLFVRIETQYLSARRRAKSSSSRTSHASLYALARTAASTTPFMMLSPGRSAPAFAIARSSSAARLCCWACTRALRIISAEPGCRPRGRILGFSASSASWTEAAPGDTGDAGDAGLAVADASASGRAGRAGCRRAAGDKASSASSQAACKFSCDSSASITACRAAASSGPEDACGHLQRSTVKASSVSPVWARLMATCNGSS
mmetsp:Transcript_85960/g.277637  ORF Transcript_85960/g.277637 Transcript_85960/m.277637 type:complete len:356 (+) Transcript_85960:1049-2116(+)